MDSPIASRSVAGALEFLADLQVFADECVATGLWDDDLTARRRRQHEGAQVIQPHQEATRMKAL
jgi:hypothetical protein